MNLGLRGRVAVVTGGSKGIGRGVAAALAAEGARVAVTSRSAERAAEAAAQIGPDVRGYGFDSDDLDAIDPLMDAVRADLGDPDVYIANTGGPPTGDPFGFSREQWEAAHRSLLLSPLAIVERVLPAMRARGFGRIVAVGSSTIREPLDFLQLSNAHRPGLVTTFKVLARQAAADGVTFNHVHPGQILTDRILSRHGSVEEITEHAKHTIPAGRLGTVDEMGAVVAFLCSAQAAYVTGTAVLVDGGYSAGV